MREPPDTIRFRCPLCGSQVYERVVVVLPSGKPHVSSLLQCAGCSVVFRDKVRFTRRAKFEPGLERSPTPTVPYSDGPEE